MYRILAPLAITGMIMISSYAVADDEISQAGMAQQHKAMKDCMAKHAAQSNAATKSDMEKACKEELKAQKDQSMMPAPQK